MPTKIKQTPPARAGNYTGTRLNAIKHGATSETLVLPWESQEEFDARHADLVRYYQPVGPMETYHLDRIAGIMWRSRRLQGAENAVYAKALERVIAAAAEGPDVITRVALAHLAPHFAREETARAVSATEAETVKEWHDLEEAEDSITKALQYLEEGAPDSYQRALSSVIPEIKIEWSGYQPRNVSEMAIHQLPKVDEFRFFLKNRKMSYYRERRFFLENRQRIREQAFGEAAYDPGLEPLARHEVHLDRRLEKHLTMLLTLQERRGKVFTQSVLQKMQKAEQPDDADEPDQSSGTEGS
jgi:hypothetical protein